MKDGKITKKGGKLPGGSSLALRVALICLSLLVFPLLFHTFFLYQQEEKLKEEEVKEILKLAANSQKLWLDERIEMGWLLLEAVNSGIQGIEHQREITIFEMPLPEKAGDQFVSLQEGRLLIGVQTESDRALAFSTPIDFSVQKVEAGSYYSFSIHFVLSSNEMTPTLPSNAIESRTALASAPLTISAFSLSDEIQGIRERQVIYRFISFLLFVAAFGGIAVAWLTRRMARPLHELSKVLLRISQGAVHLRYKPDRMGFEINALGEEFNKTLDALLWHQQEIERERLEREKLAGELRIGHEIQASLFPTQIPEIPGLEIAPGYLPSREVGGDFYDLFPLENGKLFIAIADTAGKGISACLYSLGMRSSLRSFAISSSELSKTIAQTNDLFWTDAKNTGMFVTVWAALFEPKSRKLTYCNQGHTPAMLIRAGKIQELATPGIALGAQKFDTAFVEEIQVERGDLLFLYTDGVVEAHDPDSQLFGSKRLREFLVRNHKNPPSKIVDQIIEEIHLFGQGAPQHDDLTVLAIRF